MLEKPCIICNASFWPLVHNSLACSKECQEIYKKIQRYFLRIKPDIIKKCLYCKKDFLPFSPNSHYKFCSKKCSNEEIRKNYLRPKIKKKCKICKTSFYCPENFLQHTCSKKCGKEYKSVTHNRVKKEIKKCHICKTPFPARKDQILCSKKCQRKDKKKKRQYYKPPKYALKEKVCKLCNKKFIHSNRLTLCSKKCKEKWPSKRHLFDIEYKLRQKLKIMLRRDIDKIKKKKYNLSSGKLLGCSLKELKIYLESKFLPGMTWKNHSFKGWHIDHIKPIASFNINIKEEREKCFHFSNLQPLWAFDNLSKGDKIIS